MGGDEGGPCKNGLFFFFITTPILALVFIFMPTLYFALIKFWQMLRRDWRKTRMKKKNIIFFILYRHTFL
jgi:hypothetical protein